MWACAPPSPCPCRGVGHVHPLAAHLGNQAGIGGLGTAGAGAGELQQGLLELAVLDGGIALHVGLGGHLGHHVVEGGLALGQKAIRSALADKTRALLAIDWTYAPLKEAAQKWLDTMDDGEANQEATKAYIAALEEGLNTVDDCAPLPSLLTV